MIPFGNVGLFKESKCIQFMLYNTPGLSGYVNGFVQPVREVIDLTDKVASKKITMNDANLEALDIMLKYKVVDKVTVESLVEVNKLKGVTGVESVLSKY